MRVLLLASVEKLTISRSNSIIVRSNKARDVLLEKFPLTTPNRIFIARNGRDANAYLPLSQDERLRIRKKLGFKNDDLVFAYVGSVDEQKYNFSRVLELFSFATNYEPNSKLIVLTNSKEYAQQKITEFNLSSVAICLSVSPSEVPEILGACDVGVSLINQSESMKMVSPIKIGEYLLAGLSIVSTTGIGDLNEVLSGTPIVWLTDLSTESLNRAAMTAVQTATSQTQRRIEGMRNLGLRYFSNEQTVHAYKHAFEEAIKRPG